MQTSDLSLWRCWLDNRDTEAFAQLVLPELPHALGMARCSGLQAADAEDVVQDCLSDLARDRSERPIRVGLRPWMLRAVRSRAGMALRSAKRRRRREMRNADVDASAPDRSLELRRLGDCILLSFRRRSLTSTCVR